MTASHWLACCVLLCFRCHLQWWSLTSPALSRFVRGAQTAANGIVRVDAGGCIVKGAITELRFQSSEPPVPALLLV